MRCGGVYCVGWTGVRTVRRPGVWHSDDGMLDPGQTRLQGSKDARVVDRDERWEITASPPLEPS